MNTDRTIRVSLASRGYEINIGSGNLQRIGATVAELKPSSAVVVTDRHVRQPYAERVVSSLEDAACSTLLEVVEPGEATKSVKSANQLWISLLERGADRKSVVIAVGGGVVGDLAGFVAASFARGIPLFQVPTTLLAQVDSSVGGKVGVNLPSAKNMVGAFWQPVGVLIDTDVLSTLPDREYKAGLAEVVKYGVILDEKFFVYLEDNVEGIMARESPVLQHIVARCCQIKAEVVAADEREESGQRAKLNYGHTFCHAIEAVTGYGRYLHGEAVSIGMLCASRLAESQGLIGHNDTERQRALLERLGLPLEVPEIDPQQFVEAMQRDKKTERGQLRFVLPSRIGAVDLVSNIPHDQILAALKPSIS